MSESESSSRDVVIGISIGLVILAGLYVYLSPDETTSDAPKRPAIAQDNAKQAKPKKATGSNKAKEEPSIRVRKTKDGVFVERTEPLKSDPAFYREKSVFERSLADGIRPRVSQGQAANGRAGGGEGDAPNTPKRDANGEVIPDGDAPANNGERTGGNQAGGWY